MCVVDIFLDTNILYNNWFLTNANFKFLLNFISNDGHTLLICDVVKNEIEHKHSEELQKNIKKLKESLDELYKLTNIREKVDTEKFDIKYSILDIFNSGGIDYKEISCDSIPQSTVMYRAINRIRPFQDNEKGYRDTLIWLTLLNYANSEESDNDIIFICENKNDFYDPAKKSLVEFHPDLCKDLLSVNVNKKIVPFLGLSSFISSRIDKDKHAINHNKLEQLIESDIDNGVDDFNREALAIEIDLNPPAQRVVRVLDRIVVNRGYPLKMRMDNGPELVSLALAQWAEEHGVQLEFIKPGKPTQNAFIERFNRTYRTEILDFYLFRTLNEAQEITERWLMAEKPEISKSAWN
ncbi:TPA: DUF4935 domain-containing protein [Klebsiella pneumoniae]|nr:DUF4935 domain-containing protein [Klebsiella pneumoniae]HBX6949230.1 DUF4935 domain-containing protein [Klebsiella pneumoniae]HBX7057137.1 DUF4935 domain-containing protein [Klebsiella pneumoniae]HBX7083908.1 DUF4935 domain-containing protein [Klebsiella pneumoniae]HBX7110635.1 DUF4935 domain-containing protein [Klebsiella pneumoniae]